MSNIENYLASSTNLEKYILDSVTGEKIYVKDLVVALSRSKSKSKEEWDGTVPAEIVAACAEAGVPLLDAKDFTFYDEKTKPKPTHKPQSQVLLDMDMIEPVMPEMLEDYRIRTYLHPSVWKILYESMGPNWEFHAQQEILMRSPDVLAVDDLAERIKIFAEKINAALADFNSGTNIKNLKTLQAIYNWKPELLVRDKLAENPDWITHRINRDGLSIVVRVHEKDNFSKGFNIPHHPLSERLRRWKVAAEAVRDGTSLCDHCTSLSYEDGTLSVPPPPALVRQNAVIYYCNELLPYRCRSCDLRFTTHISF